jgi:hypothetical protein
MALTIGQAVYGERERGHRLLGASTSFPNADALAGRMDMQGSPPPHTDWDPYLSGFAWNEHYIFSRTMPDPQSTRPGMVFSRAFALPAQKAAALNDIGGLFDLLSRLGDSRGPVGDVDWQPGLLPPAPNPGLVQALLRDGADPVVWPGQAGFAEALASLWSALWPSARLALNFRVAFSPTDVVADAPTLVTTPHSLLTRWSEFRIVRPDALAQSNDIPERYLLGETAAGNLGGLVSALGEQMPAIREIRRIAEIDQLPASGGGFDDYLDALRLACHLAPDAGQGESLKQELIEQAVRAMPQASAAQMRMARNLDLASTPSRQDFWDGLAAWSKTTLWREKNIATFAQLLDDAFSAKPVLAWRTAVRDGVRAALARPAQSVAKTIWTLLGVRPNLLASLVQGIAHARTLETALVDSAPAKLEPASADAIAREALPLNMITLHAACCAISLPAVEAMQRHLAQAPFDLRSLAIAAAKAKGPEIIAIAIERCDAATLALAAKAVANSPALLTRIDVAVPRWRALLTEVLCLSPTAVAGSLGRANAVAKLLDGVLGGTITDEALLEALSTTPLADLAHYPPRENLWPLLSEPMLSRYLASTADGWLGAIERGEELSCDAVLAQEVVRPERLDPALSRLAAQPARGCFLFRALPRLDQARFGQWFREVLQRNNLVQGDAEAIGRLVASRNWDQTARDIADFITDDNRNELRPAVDYIVEMIGMIRRYFLDETGSSTPVSAKWRILEEIALELYGYGPADGRLWQRAGGRESDIPKKGTGADAWRKVLGDAEKGKGAIRVAELIKVMAEDYPYNRALQKLRWDSKFGAAI